MADEVGTKERVYDAEISPLMAQIIGICKRAGIPVHAGFALDGDTMCTTHVAPAEDDVVPDDLEAYDEWCDLYGRPATKAVDASPTSPFSIVVRDAAGQVKRVETIL